MAGCPSCGRANPDDARFCSACGTELAAAPAREVRKIVTVLFADVVGSTQLGETTDPEALRARMRSYFEDLRVIVERHGGTVEKFVGDAVMAVFGIPVAHEDDALRAVRAASEMREAVAGHGLEARIGVNTGEVVTGGGRETLVTGDAVNVAARLEQAAAPGEAVIGARTLQLVRDAVLVEALEPLTLKGKAEPVEAYRLVAVLADAEALARHPHAPLIGRRRERERLNRDFEDVIAERTCRLFTLLGPAGIGKSRLVAEFLGSLDEGVDVLRGRCLHYGEGITYWPLVEILVRLGIDPEGVIGMSPEETRLEFRRVLEARASERAQVVVLEDLQWAEPTFLDLVEHVADYSRDAPIFLLCIARTELLDLRRGWGGGKVNATSVLLEPLRGDECAMLIENLLGGVAIDDGLRARITSGSQGNPLFVEEMLAMVRERDGDGEIVVPPTIQALLQARLDTLEGDERLVIERGSVEGEVFHRGAVLELAPDLVRAALGSHLATLVRKELIRSVAPAFVGDEGFRFRHLLIRDAAYESLPKATRAELHERFAGWLAQHDLVERDEILGYHLEQAHRYRAELDVRDPVLPVLGERAAEHLAAAGTGAMDRGDWAAARGLLRRAWELLPPGAEGRALLAPELGGLLAEGGEFELALAVVKEGSEARDPVARARGVIAEIDVSGVVESGPAAEEHKTRREEARAVLEAAGDDLGLAQYWRSYGYDFWSRCRATEAKEAWERGIDHARTVGATRIEHELLSVVFSCVVLGPTPVPEAVEWVRRALEDHRGSALSEASAFRALGRLISMVGEFDEGRDLIQRARATFREAGLLVTAAGWAMAIAALERRAGDLEAEERALREGCDVLEQLGDRYFYSTAALMLAECLCHRSRDTDDEIRAICATGRERSVPDDLVNLVYLDAIEACLLARQGRFDEAVEVGRRALELAETTDHVDTLVRTRMLLVEVHSLAGDREEATRLGSAAVATAEAKGDVAGAAWAMRRLGELGVRLPE